MKRKPQNASERPDRQETTSICRDFFNLSRNLTMNRKYLSTLTLALAALAAGNALAADAAAAKTRDQVRAELAEAQRTGDIVAHGNSGQKLNELYPSQYPAKAVTQGNTREQVLAELAQAKRSGEYEIINSYGSH
jgi:hypothetical protein